MTKTCSAAAHDAILERLEEATRAFKACMAATQLDDTRCTATDFTQTFELIEVCSARRTLTVTENQYSWEGHWS